MNLQLELLLLRREDFEQGLTLLKMVGLARSQSILK
jgi:hypothetical protein